MPERTRRTTRCAATLKAYAGVARAPFLVLPVTLVASGAAASRYSGSFNWLHTILAVVGLVALHAGVDALNEASDMRRGIDLETKPTPFSGGSGTLASGALSVRQATVFGLACSLLGLLIGIWFLWKIGWVLLPFIVAGGFFVAAYTDLLARTGLGEAAAGLGLGALPVLGTAVVQDGTLAAAAVAASVPAFFMTFNLLLLNEFPDEAADRSGGRRNLVLLLGRRAAARIYAAAFILTPLSVVAAVTFQALPAHCLVAVLPSVLAARRVFRAIGKPDDPVPVPALGANVAWNLATNALLAAALVAATLKPGG